MKIVSIFAPKLYAFHFDSEDDNEYDRNIELWQDVQYLKDFAKQYKPNSDIKTFIEERLQEAEELIDLIDDIAENETEKLEVFFQPLHNSECRILNISLQKGKLKRQYRTNDLRLYAIRIDENCFVITGGAIKVSQTMQENELTFKELQKLEMCKAYLQEHGVFDCDSFFELMS